MDGQNPSVYAPISDAVITLLKELSQLNWPMRSIMDRVALTVVKYWRKLHKVKE
jgi:hypothetical protein